VLTNEDLASKTGVPVNTVGPTGSKTDTKNSSIAAGPKKGEAYWRGRAKQVRDEIDKVDKQIKALNDKTKGGEGEGIKIGFETYNSVIYADFESQVKELEKHKEKLQKAMTALEEEARKDGALPGWLR
jgi:peptidoglycan hydrolase CwlO-like protein